MPKLTKRERSIAAKYRKAQKAAEKGARYYALADQCIYAIAQMLKGEHGRTARINTDGKGIMLLDNFVAALTNAKRKPDEMPKAWGHGSVRQFELKEINLFTAEP